MTKNSSKAGSLCVPIHVRQIPNSCKVPLPYELGKTPVSSTGMAPRRQIIGKIII